MKDEKEMRLYPKLLLLIGFLIMFSGCTVFQANTDLISPPQLPGAKEEIKIAISKYLPDSVELQTPLNNPGNNPIILIDLDGDGEDEAIVFYKLQKQSDPVKGIVLKNKNGWTKIADINGEGTVLIDLAFSDLNQDGNQEILAGFAYTKDSTDYGLLVYDIFSESTPKILLNKPYSYFLIDHFDSNKINSLVLIKFIREQRNTISLYENRDGELVEIDQLELYPYINEYYNVQSGGITEKERGLMLDAGIGAHSALTFVIPIKEGVMQNQFSGFDDPTFKAAAVLSEDTNHDGILEYGVLEEPYMEDVLPHASTPYITVYYQLNDHWESNIISKAYIDYEHLYKVNIPLDWPRIQIDISEDRKHIEIKPAGTDVILFDVYVSEKEHLTGDNWFILGETDDFVYLSKTATNENQSLFQLLQPLDLIK